MSARQNMILDHIKLVNFKNYHETDVEFRQGINCIVGSNGMGKTNMLDAIHYLCMTRSAINPSDQQNVLEGQSYLSIIGQLNTEKRHQVNCFYEQGKKKVIKFDGKEVERLSEHIGRIPCVITTPDDNEIIKEGSEIRRKTFDGIISQSDASYLKQLIKYAALVKQRNAFLKENEGRSSYDRKLLQSYDQQLIPLNLSIATVREELINRFIPYFQSNYKSIFSEVEKVEITYKTDCLSTDFEEHYYRAQEKDVILQRTTVGCHKDDYFFSIKGKPVKKFGSQGQQKSFLLALKLAEYDFLSAIKKTSPVLLLDDVFDKLDDERIDQMVSVLCDLERFPQVFLTDARAERTKNFFRKADFVTYFEIENGQIA